MKTFVLAGALGLATLIMSGCGGGSVAVGYRAYDPYYSDYHVWGPDEEVYYNRWVVESHHPRVQYNRLRSRDRHDYYTWRHGQR